MKKKIIFVNNKLGYYGAENVLLNLVNHLDLSKYDITVLTLTQGATEQLGDGIHYKYIYSARGGIFGKIRNKILLLLGYERLAPFFCKGYDVAVAFKMGESAKLVGYSDAPQKYCWIHSNVSDIEERCSYSFDDIETEKEFLHRFTSMVAVSNCCAESFFKKYGSDFATKVIYNTVDAERIKQLAEESIPEKDKWLFHGEVPIIGTIARIDGQKRIDRLIYISEQLDKKKVDHRIIVIGDGVDYKDCVAQIKRKNLHNIHLIGFRKNPYAYLKKFDLFVCSSIWESYSIVVHEALTLGIPVVSTKCGGPEEVLQYGKYGVLTENNEASLYAAVARFLSDGMQCVEKYDSDCSMSNFILSIDKLFLGE